MTTIMTTITIPQGYGYVAGGILTTVPLLMVQSIIVHRYRDAARIQYPQLYAEKAEADASPAAAAFNRAQRAHQNTLENIPMIYVMTILSGLKYPIPSAIACAFWALSRIAYTRGYLADAAMRGASPIVKLSYIGFFGIIYGSFRATWDLIRLGV